MSNTQHTPGPWTDEQITGRDPLITGGALRLIKADGFVIAFAPMWMDDERVEARANARLIAAAPELLAALIAMTQQTNSTELAEAHDIARAAIAKATGAAS